VIPKPVPPAPAPPAVDVIAASGEATGTDSKGNDIAGTGGNLELVTVAGTAKVSIPIALEPGETLATYSCPGVTFADNTLTISCAASKSGNHVFSVQDEKGGVNARITIATGEATGTEENVLADVRSIKLDTDYTSNDFSSIDSDLGEIAGKIDLDLNTLPTDVTIRMSTSTEPDPDAQSAFALAASEAGVTDPHIAYVLSVDRDNLENGTAIESAVITMKVGPDWVDSHGGVDAVQIIRYDPDTGEQQVLETEFAGYDEEGRAVFTGNSPNGLSVFGLMGKAPEVISAPAPTPVAAIEPTTGPAIFSVGDLRISPKQIANGETTTVTVDVANTGETGGKYEVVLKIDNVTEVTREVTLEANAKQQVVFNVTREMAGAHAVEIDGLSGSFTVQATPAPIEEPPARSSWRVILGVTLAGLVVFMLVVIRRRSRAGSADMD